MFFRFLVAQVSFQEVARQLSSSKSEGDGQTQHEGSKNDRERGNHRLPSNTDLFQGHGNRQRPDDETDGPTQELGRKDQ